MIKVPLVEKYRPKSIEEYVFTDNLQKTQIMQWISDKELPNHVLFAGIQGTGKTSLALLLLDIFGIPKMDRLIISASSQDERGIGKIAEVERFCSTFSLGRNFKYIILDEADKLTPSAQDSLKGVLEKYYGTVRFIFTCNRPNMITKELKSRLLEFHFKELDINTFTARIGEILVNENIEFDIDLLSDNFIKKAYPDMRKCINLISQSIIGGELQQPIEISSNKEYLIEAMEFFKSGNISQARKIITTNARQEEYLEIYRYFYRNAETLWKDADTALIIISKNLHRDSTSADREITLAATLSELGKLNVA